MQYSYPAAGYQSSFALLCTRYVRFALLCTRYVRFALLCTRYVRFALLCTRYVRFWQSQLSKMSQAKEKLGTKRRRLPVNEKSDTGIIWKKQN